MAASEAQKRAMKKYQQTNREKCILLSRKYKEDHPDYNANYYRNNLEKERERLKLYQRNRYLYIKEARRLANIFL